MVKYIKWLLPVLFIAYYSSVSLFTHVHVEHGTTIVHAHPFKKTADGTCHHHASLAEIQLFHMLSSIHVMDGAIHPLRLQFYSSLNPQLHSRSATYIKRNELLIRKTAIKSSHPFQYAYHSLTP